MSNKRGRRVNTIGTENTIGTGRGAPRVRPLDDTGELRQFNLVIGARFYERIVSGAARNGVTASELVRRAVREYLDRDDLIEDMLLRNALHTTIRGGDDNE